MNRFVVAGKQGAYQYYIEGVDKEKVVASLYLTKNKPVTREFTNKGRALAWVSGEVNKLMEADFEIVNDFPPL